MKIKKIITFCVAILLFSTLFGCAKQNDLDQSLSRLRKDAFRGETENYLIDVYPELCESPMIADGVTSPAKKKVILKLKIKNGKTGDYKVSFTTDKEYSDNMSFSTVSDCFVSTVSVQKLPDKPFIVTITHENESENVNMESRLLPSTVSYEKALYSAYLYKKDYVDGLSSNGVFNGEIYVRLIAEGDKNFWYVGFITSEQTVCVLLSNDATVLEEKTVKNPPYDK